MKCGSKGRESRTAVISFAFKFPFWVKVNFVVARFLCQFLLIDDAIDNRSIGISRNLTFGLDEPPIQ